MKRVLVGLITAMVFGCIGSMGCAADGDLTVNGNVSVGTNLTVNGNGTFNGNYVAIGTTTPIVRLDVNGQLNVRGSSGGTYWPYGTAAGINFTGATSQFGLQLVAGTTGPTYDIFFTKTNNPAIGYIYDDGSQVYYVAGSDRRLKENIGATTVGLATLLKIPVADFNFIADPQKIRRQGFIAQDLYAIYPQAVVRADDGVSPLSTSTPNTWGVDYGRLTPLIIKSIQDLEQEIQALKAQIQQLKGP